MIRKNISGDISDEEFESILKPFIDDYDDFVISYIMPEIIAYYIVIRITEVLCMKVLFFNITILLKI